MSEWGDAGKVFVKLSPNEDRERKKRKTRGYVSRCPNFIHSRPFVRLLFFRPSASFLYSFVRSFFPFVLFLFVCWGGELFLCDGFCHAHGVQIQTSFGQFLAFRKYLRFWKKFGHLCFASTVHCYILQSHLHCCCFFFNVLFSPFLFLLFVLYCHFLWLVASLLLMFLLGGIVHPFVQRFSSSFRLTLLFHFDAFSYSSSKILLWSMTFSLLLWKILNHQKKLMTFGTKVLLNMFRPHPFLLPFSFPET